MSVWIHTNNGNQELPTLLSTTWVSGYSYYYRTTVGTNELIFDLWNGSQWQNGSGAGYSPYAFAYYINNNYFVDYAGSTDPVRAVQEGTSNYDNANYSGNLELKNSSGTVVYKFLKPVYASYLNNGAEPPSGSGSGGTGTEGTGSEAAGSGTPASLGTTKVFCNFW